MYLLNDNTTMLNGITLAISIIVIGVILLFTITLLLNLFFSPLVGTPKKILGEIVDKMQLDKDDTLIDLGSGDGRLLLEAYKQSRCHCIGYELSPIPVLLARTKRILNYPNTEDISFELESIFQVEILEATKVYCYLDEKSLQILTPKLEHLVRSCGEIYSLGNKIPKMKEYERVVLSNKNIMYIYKKCKK